MKYPRYLILSFALLSAGIAPVMATPDGWAPLLEPAGLEDILSRSPDVRVVRLTGDYQAGHIPGAVSIPYAQFRGPQSSPGQLPGVSALTALLQQAGISDNTPVVLVHEGSSPADMGSATRVYWTMKSLGIEDLAVLNGGFNAWKAQGLPVSSEGVVVSASSYTATWNDAWRVTTGELERLVENDAPLRLVDARPGPFFQGLQASGIPAGTISGAVNLGYTEWFDGPRLKPLAELQSRVSAGLSDDAPRAGTVTFCNTGHLGSINWFVMSELLGMENTRLYAESMTEWTQSGERPLDNTPR